MNKRAFLLAQLHENETLQKQKDIRLPVINSDCNFFSACTILCPTEALKMETENNLQSITLEPSKCVDCSLCEDICFTKSIGLQYQTNEMLLNKRLDISPGLIKVTSAIRYFSSFHVQGTIMMVPVFLCWNLFFFLYQAPFILKYVKILKKVNEYSLRICEFAFFIRKAC
jgi:ferredoxin